tara:strand:+ start:3511 stop:4617 length:1107 start_codon:yes stop_codon:yes gene_type:complete
MPKEVLLIFGTRPEAIKLAPLIMLLKKNPNFNISICVSSQHVELLNQVLNFFGIEPTYNLNIMTKNQSLFDITTKCLDNLKDVIKKCQPQLIIVQGDTTTAFAGALAGFYERIPVAHIEAGLRTLDRNNPYPEEVNRKLIAQLATYHFAPTESNKNDLIQEGIDKNIWVVGNTVIDALNHTLKIVKNGFRPPFEIKKEKNSKLILVTGHRRESVGEPFTNLCNQLSEIATHDKSIQILFSLHLNPQLQEIAKNKLSSITNISLINPQTYPNFIWMMSKSDLIITDSGGIQEEAPYLGVPVIITRKETERKETITQSNTLIDLKTNSIIPTVKKILAKSNDITSPQDQHKPYGNGDSAKKIIAILESEI